MECPSIPVFDVGTWYKKVILPLEGQRYPLSGTFELTDRCGFDCVHCYINQPVSSKAAKADELTTSQVKHIFDQIVDAGCMFLTLTGGDPLVRSDFEEIYRYARQLGLIVSVYTNGALITPQIAELFEEITPRVVEITLYGATAETFEKVTRVPGSFNRVMRGIKLLNEKNVPITLKMMIMTINQHEFAAIRQIADTMGVSFRYDGLLWPRLTGEQSPFECQLPLNELIKMEFDDPATHADWIKLAERSSREVIDNRYVFNCGIGYHGFHIDSNGQLCGCMSLRRPSFDLRQMTFQEGWEKLGLFIKLQRQEKSECDGCKLNLLCDQCPGWSQNLFGDLDTPVRFLCELAHLRAEEINQLQLTEVNLEEF